MIQMFIFTIFLVFNFTAISIATPSVTSGPAITLITSSSNTVPTQNKDKNEPLSDTEKIIYTASATVLTGLIVFVLGQFILKFIIEPMQDLKKTIGEIRYSLSFHARPIFTPITKEALSDQAENDLRRLSCTLNSKVETIPCYRFFSAVGCVLPKKNILTSASHLMALSNSVHKPDRTENQKLVDNIRRLLNISIPVEKYPCPK